MEEQKQYCLQIYSLCQTYSFARTAICLTPGFCNSTLLQDIHLFLVHSKESLLCVLCSKIYIILFLPSFSCLLVFHHQIYFPFYVSSCRQRFSARIEFLFPLKKTREDRRKCLAVNFFLFHIRVYTLSLLVQLSSNF